MLQRVVANRSGEWPPVVEASGFTAADADVSHFVTQDKIVMTESGRWAGVLVAVA